MEKLRPLVVLALIASLCTTATALGSPVASAAIAVEPAVTLIPATGHAGGQTIEVQLAGFDPFHDVGYCQGVLDLPLTTSDCGPGLSIGTTDATGELVTTLTLQRFFYAPSLGRWVDCVDPADTCIVAATGLSLVGTVAFAELDFAEPPPGVPGEVTFSPNPPLGDGDTVTVTGSGFTAGAPIDVYQCAADPVDPSTCSGPGATVTADASGGFSTNFSVRANVFPPGAPSIACFDLDGSCVVAAAEAADFPGTVATEPILAPAPRPPREVVLVPASGHTGGQTIEVQLKNFDPLTTVGWCQGVLDLPIGLDDCASSQFSLGSTDATGELVTTLTLQRFFYAPSLDRWVDCADPADTCAVGAASLNLLGTIVFAELDFPEPPPGVPGEITLSPERPSGPGDTVTVTGSGFTAGAPVDVHQCVNDPVDPSTCSTATTTVTADASGGFSTNIEIEADVDPPGGSPTACFDPDGVCVVAAAEAADFPGTVATQPILLPEPMPVVMPGVGAVFEGDEPDQLAGASILEVTVSLSVEHDEPVIVPWSTIFLDRWDPVAFAEPGDDYVAAEGVVVFEPGEIEQSVPIVINGDVANETDELVVVSFRKPTNARIGGFWGLGFGLITDNDSA